MCVIYERMMMCNIRACLVITQQTVKHQHQQSLYLYPLVIHLLGYNILLVEIDCVIVPIAISPVCLVLLSIG